MKILLVLLFWNAANSFAFSTDFNARKRDGAIINEWAEKVHRFDRSTPNQEMVRLAYAPSRAGPTPYESMKSTSAFLDDAAKKLSESALQENQLQAKRAKVLSQKFKYLTATLDIVKNKDNVPNSVDNSLSVSAAYGRLLEFKSDPQFSLDEFNKIVIATANAERTNVATPPAHGPSRVVH